MANLHSAEHCFYPVNPTNPKPYVSYGRPLEEVCADHARSFRATRIYLVISRSLKASRALNDLQNALGTTNIVRVHVGVAQHTPWHAVFDLVQGFTQTRADLIITVGGGSITDAVKLARLFVANGVTSFDKVDWILSECKPGNPTSSQVHPASIPVINVPTTLSGAEFTSIGGGTNTESDHQKRLAIHSSMYADIVILDPKLSISTPSRVWLSSGIRAVDHLVESLYGNVASARDESHIPNAADDADNNKKIVDTLHTLLLALIQTKRDWENLDARLREFLAVTYCPQAASNGVGASHGIGHQLGPFGVGHGETSCVMLPSVLKYNYLHGDDRLRQNLDTATAMFWADDQLRQVLQVSGLMVETADLGDVIGAYVNYLGLPRSLSHFGIREDQFDSLAENSLKDVCTQINPVQLDREKVLEILRMAT